MIHLLALIGVISISFSAVFVRLAAVSPATVTFYRMLYAVPVLVALKVMGRTGDRRPRRERLLGLAGGLLLALDLQFWHTSIAFIGAGLGTVIANVQVVFVALAAWLVHGERPTARTATIVPIVLAGVVLTSGLSRHDAYGTSPTAGVVLGVGAGLFYAAFLLFFRAANRSLAPAAGPLLDCTIGAAVGALACGVVDPRFAWLPTWPAHLWLILLALMSQVFGWLLIGDALPRLPAIETSVLLLGQPALAVLWGLLIFDERLSALQWTGTAVVLLGVAALSIGMQPRVVRSAVVQSVGR